MGYPLICGVLEQATKPCIKCGETKPLLKFPSVKRGRYRGATCNACRHAARAPDLGTRARVIRWREANRERHLQLKRAESDRRRRKQAERDGRQYLSPAVRKEVVAKARLEREAQAARLKADRKTAADEARRARAIERPWLTPGLSDAEKFKVRYELDGLFHLKSRMRRYIRKTLARHGQSKRVELSLGYSMEELRRHLERQFVRGMSWELFTRGDIHIDHRVPLSAFDLTDPGQMRAAWALSNLQPMWAKDNIAKGGRRELLV